MKIVHLIDRFSAKAEYQEHYLARFQARQGHDVWVATSDMELPVFGPGRLPVGVSQRDGYTVLRLPAACSLGNGAVVMRGLGQVLEKLSPHAIHAHGLTYRLSVWQAARFTAVTKCKLIVDSHENYMNTHVRSNYLKRLYHWAHRHVVGRYVKRYASSFPVIGEEERQFLCAEYLTPTSKTPLIPLGVDCDRFRPDREARCKVRMALGVTSDTVLLIHTGKMGAEKEVDRLIEALWRLHQEGHCHYKLLLVGTDREVGYIKGLKQQATALGLGEHVIWQEFSPPDVLSGYFASADIAIWPGSLSISILEAMASGLPLVMADHTTYADMYLAAENGLRFRRGDVGSLVQAVLGATQAGNAMSIASRNLAVKRFDWTAIAERFIDLYRS